MKHKVVLLLVFCIGLSAVGLSQKPVTALKMPADLLNYEKRINILSMLSDGTKLDRPWVVFSDRGEDFGQMYYVVKEDQTKLELYKADSHDPSRRLRNPEYIGWRDKQNLLVYFGADFTRGSMIHKKCVILNKKDVVERIKAGELEESQVPKYKSPDDTESFGNAPLYFIYFVYKAPIEGNRILIGKDFKMEPSDFKGQIYGWVDKNRVYEYENRICFEPNYENSAVQFRRCNPEFQATAFERSDELRYYIKGDTSYRGFWKEPNYYYFKNPEWKPNSSLTPYWPETKKLPDTLLQKLCDKTNWKNTKLLTEKPLPGHKFRFPLIKLEKGGDDIFHVGIAGRESRASSSKDYNCDDIKQFKSKLNIFFVSDNAIEKNRLSFALGLINQDYKQFDKSYGACFYPMTFAKNWIDLGDKGPNQREPNYTTVRNFLKNYIQDKNVVKGQDNYLHALKSMLGKQNFNKNQTNIIVILNSRTPSQDDFASMHELIETKLMENNCFLIAIDFSANGTFKDQIKLISKNVNKLLAQKNKFATVNADFEEMEGMEVLYSYTLAAISQKKPGESAADVTDKLITSSGQRIINTVDNLINLLCSNEQSSTGVKVNMEDPFVQAQVGNANSWTSNKVQSVRYLQEGYIPRKFRKEHPDLWKADVLFTADELRDISHSLSKLFDDNKTSSEKSEALYDLFTELFDRFVGEDIPEARLRELTPTQIMSDIIGEAFGYNVDASKSPLKGYTLSRIKSNDRTIERDVRNYWDNLIKCHDRIKQVLAGREELKFSIDEGCKENCVYYYWIPMDMLP